MTGDDTGRGPTGDDAAGTDDTDDIADTGIVDAVVPAATTDAAEPADSPRTLADTKAALTDEDHPRTLADTKADIGEPEPRDWFVVVRSRLPAPVLDFAGKSRDFIHTDLRARLLSPDAGNARLGWIITGIVTAIAAVLRLAYLGRPGRIVFDETYYVKEAFSLLAQGYEGNWTEIDDEQPNEQFAAGDYSMLETEPDYIVHPAVGKWMIAIGMKLLGPNDPVSWRISAAIVGTLMVFMLVRIARRLFASNVLAGTAGLLLAIDGNHLVMSRISILDIFLSFWALAAFGAILLDRHWYRQRLAARAADELAEHGKLLDLWGPKVGFRPWLLVAGVCLGLSCGVKWSGIYFVAAFGVFVVAWTVTARRSIGAKFWVGGGTMRDGIPAFLLMVPTAAAVYVLTWLPWWLQPDAFMRQWAVQVNAVAANPQRPWMPDWLNSWWEYHLMLWHFHNNLTSEHTYMSHPGGWLIQWRPTSFAFRTVEGSDGAMQTCGAEKCAQAILALGNPVIWWGAALALVLVLWAAIRRQDWRAWAILAGYVGGYLPWFAYAHRTIFTFYTVAFVPYVVLTLTFAIGELIGSRDLPLRERRPGIWAAAAIVLAAIGVSAFYWPIWSGQWVPYWFWQVHMLLPSWI